MWMSGILTHDATVFRGMLRVTMGLQQRMAEGTLNP